MKKHMLFIGILVLIFSCDKTETEIDTLPKAESWRYNNETLGDNSLSLRFNHTYDCEGRINKNEWIMFKADSTVSFPIIQFEEGENEIQLRSVSGSAKGTISSSIVWKGEYHFQDTGQTSITTNIQVVGNTAYDVVAEIRNEKGTSGIWEDDEIIYILPGDHGEIKVDKMVNNGQIFIPSANYLLYDVWFIDTFEHTINLREKVEGTTVYGTFMQHTDEGIVPMDDSYGDVTGIGVKYPDGGLGISVCYVRYYGGDVSIGSYNQDNGAYSITDVAEGTYNAYVNLRAPWGEWYNYNGPEFYVEAGESYEVNHVVERRTGTVGGIIKDNEENPVANCYLRLYKPINWDSQVNHIYSPLIQTDAQGVFSIETFYGDYTLGISRVNTYLYLEEHAEKIEEFTLERDIYNLGTILLE